MTFPSTSPTRPATLMWYCSTAAWPLLVLRATRTFAATYSTASAPRISAIVPFMRITSGTIMRMPTSAVSCSRRNESQVQNRVSLPARMVRTTAPEPFSA